MCEGEIEYRCVCVCIGKWEELTVPTLGLTTSKTSFCVAFACTKTRLDERRVVMLVDLRDDGTNERLRDALLNDAVDIICFCCAQPP